MMVDPAAITLETALLYQEEAQLWSFNHPSVECG